MYRRQYPNTVDDFRVLHDQVEDLYYLLDTGHAYLEGGDACIEAYVNTFADRILRVHVSDNRGDADSHLPVSKGTIDFHRVLTALNRHRLDVPLILEIWMKNGYIPSKNRLIEIQQTIRVDEGTVEQHDG